MDTAASSESGKRKGRGTVEAREREVREKGKEQKAELRTGEIC